MAVALDRRSGLMGRQLDAPGSLFALKDDPREQSNLYLNLGSEPGAHNGGETVEVQLTLRATVGQASPKLESDYVPGWASRLMRSDGCIRRLA